VSMDLFLLHYYSGLDSRVLHTILPPDDPSFTELLELQRPGCGTLNPQWSSPVSGRCHTSPQPLLLSYIPSCIGGARCPPALMTCPSPCWHPFHTQVWQASRGIFTFFGLIRLPSLMWFCNWASTSMAQSISFTLTGPLSWALP
jgi:hypothetical protein